MVTSLIVLLTQPSAPLPVRIMEPVHHLVYVTVQMNGPDYVVVIVSKIGCNHVYQKIVICDNT